MNNFTKILSIIMIILGGWVLSKEYVIVNQEFFVIASFLLVFYYLYKFSKDVVNEEINYREKLIKNGYIHIINEMILLHKALVKEYENKYLCIWALGDAFSEYTNLFLNTIRKDKELYFKEFVLYKTTELNIRLLRELVYHKKTNDQEKYLHKKIDEIIALSKELMGKRILWKEGNISRGERK